MNLLPFCDLSKFKFKGAKGQWLEPVDSKDFNDHQLVNLLQEKPVQVISKS